MKNIHFKRQNCYVKDIPVGECFVYADELFMVTDKLTDQNGDDIICVNLSNGTIPSTSYIDLDTVVTPANVDINVL